MKLKPQINMIYTTYVKNSQKLAASLTCESEVGMEEPLNIVDCMKGC